MRLTEKYRPETLDDIVGQPTDEIKLLIQMTDPPNILLHGEYGTGKTSAARAIARERHGHTDSLVEVNASEERGIDTVRERITRASRIGMDVNGNRPIVFLDEMEGMSVDAQEALRRPMEQTNGMFILSVNDIARVHGALKNRCRTFEFGSVDDIHVREHIKNIADKEGVDLSPDELNEIVDYADGSVRNALHRLQSHVAEVQEQQANQFGWGSVDTSVNNRSATDFDI